MFCAPRLIFGGTEGVGSRFHVLGVRTRFRRYRGCRVPYSCFALRTHFRQYRWCMVPFSCFALPNLSSTVPRLTCPVFLFCAPGHIFDGFGGVESHFHVLCSESHFRRYRGRRIPFLCFAHPDSFSTVPRALGPVFMFCAPGLVFDGAECVGSRFHVLRARTSFRRYRGRPILFSCIPLPDMFLAVYRVLGPVFHVLRFRTCFRRYRGRQLLFSCFAFSDSFSAVRWVSGPVFMFFCAPRLVFGGNEGIGSCLHVLRSRARFRRYGGRGIPFSYFALPNSFPTVPRAFDHVLMFFAP
jgi:hypothetical protein